MLTNIIYMLTRTEGNETKCIDCAYNRTKITETIKEELFEIQRNNMSFKMESGAKWKDGLTGIEIPKSERTIEKISEYDYFEITISLEDKTIVLTKKKYEISDYKEESSKWHFGTEQEFPESQWANIMGVIENSKDQSLYYAVGTDEDGNWKNCKVFSSISYDEDSFLIAYPWNDKNDKMLIEALNRLSKTYEIIEDDVLRGTLLKIPFEKD